MMLRPSGQWMLLEGDRASEEEGRTVAAMRVSGGKPLSLGSRLAVSGHDRKTRDGEKNEEKKAAVPAAR